MRKTYQGTGSKSKQKFEVMGNEKLLVEMPLPMVEVWEELQAPVEQLTGHAGLQIIGTLRRGHFVIGSGLREPGFGAKEIRLQDPPPGNTSSVLQ